MKKLMLGAMLVVVGACGVDPGADFRKGIPKSGDVALKLHRVLPGRAAVARLTGRGSQTQDWRAWLPARATLRYARA